MSKDQKGRLQKTLRKSKRLRHQRDALAYYLTGNIDVDGDVCRPQSKTGVCPFRLPPYEVDKRQCVKCIIRVLCDENGVCRDGK